MCVHVHTCVRLCTDACVCTHEHRYLWSLEKVLHPRGLEVEAARSHWWRCWK